MVLSIRAKDLLKYLDKNKIYLNYYHKMLKRYDSLNIIIKNKKDFMSFTNTYHKYNYLFNSRISKFNEIIITNYSDSKVLNGDFGFIKENWVGEHDGTQKIWHKIIMKNRRELGYKDEED